MVLLPRVVISSAFEINKEFSPEEKATIVMEGLKKNITIKELCKKYGVLKAQNYRRKKKFIEGVKKD